MAARKRHDPVSKPADGYEAFDQLRNTDPEREYCYVNPNDEKGGVEHYRDFQGYELEHKREGGPVQIGGKGVAEGTVITRFGQWLMSRPKSVAALVRAREQASVDAFEKKVLRHGNIEDGMRGLHGPG